MMDVNKMMLIPGNCGNDCPGNWENAGLNCCCDECDYMMCCLETHDMNACKRCTDNECPHAQRKRTI